MLRARSESGGLGGDGEGAGDVRHRYQEQRQSALHWGLFTFGDGHSGQLDHGNSPLGFSMEDRSTELLPKLVEALVGNKVVGRHTDHK